MTNPEQHLSRESNRFSLDLLRRTVGRVGRAIRQNHVISGASVWWVLAMLARGAGGHTRIEFERVLYGDSPIGAAEELMRTVTADDGVLRAANAIWHDTRVPLAADFVRHVESAFRAHVAGLDFSVPAAASVVINDWVASMTEGRAPTVPGPRRDSGIVTVNTTYYRGHWRLFPRGNTEPTTFRRVSGGDIQVPTMKAKLQAPFLQFADG